MEKECWPFPKRNLTRNPKVCEKVIEFYMKFGKDRDFKRLLHLLSMENTVNNYKSEKVGKKTGDTQHVEHEMKSAKSGTRLKYSKPSIRFYDEEDNQYNKVQQKDSPTHLKIIEADTSISGEYLVDLSSSTPSASGSCLECPLSKESMKAKCSASPCTSKRGTQTSSFISVNSPKKVSQGTCTIHKENADNFSQTMLIEGPEVISKETQANFSCPSSAVFEENVLPRCSECNKSSPIRSSTSLYRGANILSISRRQLITQSEPHFIDDIMQRTIFKQKYDEESSNVPKVEKLQVKFQEPLEEPINESFKDIKDMNCTLSMDISSSTLSVIQNSPELDLGIQLICLLINTKCATKNEKKKLVREIVKRITRLSGGGLGGFDPFRRNKLKPKLKRAVLSRQSMISETCSSISCDSVTQQLQEAQGAKIITPSNTVLAGSRQIHSNQAILSSIHAGSIILHNAEFQRNLKQQSSTDTVENEELISIGIYRLPTRVPQIKEQVPTTKGSATSLAREKTFMSRSTSTSDLEK